MSYRPNATREKKKHLLSLSAGALKWFGLVCVVLNILGVAVLQRGVLRLDGYTNESLYAALTPGSALFGVTSLTVVCTLFSSLGLPVFAKLTYEGWLHTGDVKRYLLRLALCALAAEIPYDLAYRGSWFDLSAQNPIWGLCLAVIMLELLRRYGQRPGAVGVLLKAAFIVAAAVWAVLLQSQLGVMFVLLCALMYCFGDNTLFVTLSGIALTVLQLPAPLGMLAVYWYDGRPGKAPRKLFYLLYPLLLLAAALVGWLLSH